MLVLFGFRPCHRSLVSNRATVDHRDPGFTLTELLVVLSILALLGALAVPALRAALDRADRTVCLSNLRQIGQAFQEYLTDYGHFPAAEWPITDDRGRTIERRRWYHSLSPYLDGPPSTWSSGQGEVGTTRSLVLPSEDDQDQSVFPAVFRCPRCAQWEVGRNMAYGYNHQTFGDARATGTDPDGQRLHRRYPVRRNEIEDPARTVLVCDSAGTGTAAYRRGSTPDAHAIGNHAFTVDPSVLPLRADGRLGSDSELPGLGAPVLPSRPAARHRGGTCVLFADSHVEWVATSKLEMDDRWFTGNGRPSER
ncbi:MAG: DUF1559 domain-containing protein [Planctomycetes bacterium]|nr:DUF1559 domain-containing protein [Planctomycetota bacterium]